MVTEEKEKTNSFALADSSTQKEVNMHHSITSCMYLEDCAQLKIYTIEVKTRECDAIIWGQNITELMIINRLNLKPKLISFRKK